MKSKKFSTVVTACCIIAFILLVCYIKCGGQTVEFRTAKPGPIIHWNNAGKFNRPEKLAARDWSTYGYTWDGKQMVIWMLYAGAGAMNACREAAHADPFVFETRYGVSDVSWWGSEQWKRSYHNNDPAQGHKSELLGNFGRDMWHTFGTCQKVFMFTGTFAIGVRKQPLKYRIVNALIEFGIQSVTSSIIYNELR